MDTADGNGGQELNFNRLGRRQGREHPTMPEVSDDEDEDAKEQGAKQSNSAEEDCRYTHKISQNPWGSFCRSIIRQFEHVQNKMEITRSDAGFQSPHLIFQQWVAPTT